MLREPEGARIVCPLLGSSNCHTFLKINGCYNSIQKSEHGGLDHRCSFVRGLKLVDRVLDMEVHRVFGDIENVRDFLGRLAVTSPFQHLNLSAGQANALRVSGFFNQ